MNIKQLKEKGFKTVLFFLPQEDIHIINIIKAKQGFTNRNEALHFLIKTDGEKYK